MKKAYRNINPLPKIKKSTFQKLLNEYKNKKQEDQEETKSNISVLGLCQKNNPFGNPVPLQRSYNTNIFTITTLGIRQMK